MRLEDKSVYLKAALRRDLSGLLCEGGFQLLPPHPRLSHRSTGAGSAPGFKQVPHYLRNPRVYLPHDAVD